MNTIAIIHFQPLEKYPPITNLIDFLSTSELKNCVTIYTTKPNKDFELYSNSCEQIIIKRYNGINNQNIVFKLFSYLNLYINIFFSICFTKPKCILYYETLSCLPALWYKAIFKSSNLFIHYHEYTSQQEYAQQSIIIKTLHKLEKKFYSKSNWISHTNPTRLHLFLKDININFNQSIHYILPNYPPKKWSDTVYNNEVINDKIKFVYIGAIGLNSMYIKQFATYIINQNGKASWDIYTNQSNDDATSFIKNLNNPNICLKGSVSYQQIPKTIKENKYNIGVILYNGHIPNYIHNAPNKLFEYLACGLQVWYPNVMTGCEDYAKTNKEYIIKKDFESLKNDEIFIITNKKMLTNNLYYYEKVYSALQYELINNS